MAQQTRRLLIFTRYLPVMSPSGSWSKAFVYDFKNCDTAVGLFQEQWHAFSSILTSRPGNPLKSIDAFSLTLATYTLTRLSRDCGIATLSPKG